MPSITNHAENRLKERCGLSKKARKRNVQKALDDGIRHSECSGKLKKYVDYLFLSYGLGNNIRIYGNHVYIFRNEILITVFALPSRLRDALKRCKEKRV